MTNKQLVELKEFKRDKRETFTDWTKNIIEWKNQKYKIEIIEKNGRHIPFVVVENVQPLSAISKQIKSINEYENKKYLKWAEYECDGDVYYVIGIGPFAIKAYKNHSDWWKWYRYSTQEGQTLLQALMNALDNQVILTEE